MKVNAYELILILNVLADYVQFLDRQDNERAKRRAAEGKALIAKLLAHSNPESQPSAQEDKRILSHSERMKKAWETRRKTKTVK